MVVSKTKHSKMKTEARSTQVSKTKHPRSKTKHPKTRKRSTQNSKTKTPKNSKTKPRSRKQIYDLQFNSKREKDPVDDLLLYARHKEDKIVLRHEDMPLDLWVLGTEIMCHDIVRFSCSDKLSYPISIDPTFNMGQYEVTPVVYKHLFLTSKRYGQSPVFLGPTMLHHKKNFDT